MANFEADLNKDGDIDERELRLLERRYKTQRQMAWIALYAILVVTGLCLFVMDTNRVQALSEVITWFFTIMGTIPLAYFGFSTWASKK